MDYRPLRDIIGGREALSFVSTVPMGNLGPLEARTVTATTTQMCPFSPNFGLKRLFVFRSNLVPS